MAAKKSSAQSGSTNGLEDSEHMDDVTPVMPEEYFIDPMKMAQLLDATGEGERQGAQGLPKANDDNPDVFHVTAIAAFKKQSDIKSGKRFKLIESRIDGLNKSNCEDPEFQLKSLVVEFTNKLEFLVQHVTVSLSEAKIKHKSALINYNIFRYKHEITHEAFVDKYTGLSTALICFSFFVLEMAFNILTFSSRHETGYTQGTLTALIVASVNVVFSVWVGYSIGRRGTPSIALALKRKRIALEQNSKGTAKELAVITCLKTPSFWWRIVCGLYFILLVVPFNIVVVGFRSVLLRDDSGEGTEELSEVWKLLAKNDFGTIFNDFIALGLLFFGLFCAAFSFYKGYCGIKDVFIGYTEIAKAKNIAEEELNRTIEKTDEQLFSLYDEYKGKINTIRESIRENIVRYKADIAEIQLMLQAHVSEGLSIDSKLNTVLKIYREANKKTRVPESVPGYFYDDFIVFSGNAMQSGADITPHMLDQQSDEYIFELREYEMATTTYEGKLLDVWNGYAKKMADDLKELIGAVSSVKEQYALLPNSHDLKTVLTPKA